MPRSPEDYLSEEEAARLWKRAAELQAEASARLEQPVLDAPEDEPADGADPSSGYELEHVRAAAVEAGIEAEYVDEALLELGAERALPPAPTTTLDRIARRALRDPPDYVEASRIIAASPQAVLESMERILPAAPYSLMLKDRIGDPARGGVLVFDIEGASFFAHEGWVGQASWADLREVYASLRPIEGAEPSCELTLRAPVAWARRINFGIGTVFTGLGAGLGAAAGSAAGAGIGALSAATGLGIVGIVLVVAVLVGGVTGGGFAGNRFFRFLYDDALAKGRKALNTLVGAIAVDAAGGWGFGSLAAGSEEPTRLPEGTSPTEPER